MYRNAVLDVSVRCSTWRGAVFRWERPMFESICATKLERHSVRAPCKRLFNVAVICQCHGFYRKTFSMRLSGNSHIKATRTYRTYAAHVLTKANGIAMR